MSITKIFLSLIFFIPLFASNALLDSASPYLRQHAHNPVNWVTWDAGILKRAKAEHKPIFLSIGYSTCHWCHVMEQESFENRVIAKIINSYFIPVKVDREEMSYLDSYYQGIFRGIKGDSGGWPLNLLLSEDGQVIWIGTYIPPHDKDGAEGVDSLMKRIGEGYQKDKSQYKDRAIDIDKRSQKLGNDANISAKNIFQSITANYDEDNHGFGIAPKFPEASKISLLLDLGEFKNKKAQTMALDILHTMALSGVYDQTEGGFFRYSTDSLWQIPHFEKMLYTQAELIPLYVRAYLLTHDLLYANIVRETIAMTQKRFENKGVFYSASDADSDNEEGGYYIYSEMEIHNLHLCSSMKESFDVDDGANFGEKFHLHVSTAQRGKDFYSVQKKLQKLRQKHHYPFVDTKIITSWNAMMIQALYSAGAIDSRYRLMAEKSLKVLLASHYVQGVLYHQGVQGYPLQQKALLEDYAFLISALIQGYESTFDEKKLELAHSLCDEAIKKFDTPTGWIQNDDGVPVRADLLDKYTTSAFGKMMQNLYILANFTEDTQYAHLAEESLKKISFMDSAQNAPSSMRAWLMGHYGIITLSHKQKVLEQNRKNIQEIHYPYLYLFVEERNDFGACTLGGCFAGEKDLKVMKQRVFEHIKN